VRGSACACRCVGWGCQFSCIGCAPGPLGHSKGLLTIARSNVPVNGVSFPFAGGTVAPVVCGNVSVYCPQGSLAPALVTPGYYSAPASGVATNATNTMARALDCPAGFYCVDGERYACPGGTSQASLRSSRAEDCSACAAGSYCPVGTASPLACGNDTVYCPAAAPLPLRVEPGYYTQGTPGARFAASLCSRGHYCPGDGRPYSCPAGRYGDMPGLSGAGCSGACADGVYCPAQTTLATGLPCPTGQYCLQGLPHACPSGTYNPVTGAESVAQCRPCPAGTFNAGNGSTLLEECWPCPANEGSGPGASACWPGIMGAFGARMLALST
jgi:hypothetical protein